MTDDVLPTGAAGDPPPTGPAKPTFDEWLADPVNSQFTKGLRAEAAANRIKANNAEGAVTKRFAEALGHDYDPANPITIDDLVGKLGTAPKDLKAARDETRTLKLDLGLEKAFNALGVKPMLARAYLSESGAMQKLKALDPASETFADDVGFHVAEAVENEPGLRGPNNLPRRTSAPMTPPGGHLGQLSREDLAGADPDDVVSALKSGRLNNLLGRQ